METKTNVCCDTAFICKAKPIITSDFVMNVIKRIKKGMTYVDHFMFDFVNQIQ